MQTHRPALLEESLYFADGQIQDEVYEYGSFLQSKMYAAGVTCTDCHDPHDLKVKGSADRVCAACHLTEKFDSPTHHFHKAELDGRELRRLPHADAQLHGRARAPRPQLPRPAAGPVGRARNAERLHAVPPGQVEPVGGRRGAEVVGRQGAPGARTTARSCTPAREELEGAAGGARSGFVADAARPAIRRATAASLLDPRGGARARPRSRGRSRIRSPSCGTGRCRRPRALEPSERLALRLAAPARSDADGSHRRGAALASVPRDADERLRARPTSRRRSRSTCSPRAWTPTARRRT